MILTLQALSLVEKAELVQVRFTPCLMEYVNARWTQSLHGIEGIVFCGHLDDFQKPPLGGKPNTKPGHLGILSAHN